MPPDRTIAIASKIASKQARRNLSYLILQGPLALLQSLLESVYIFSGLIHTRNTRSGQSSTFCAADLFAVSWRCTLPWLHLGTGVTAVNTARLSIGTKPALWWAFSSSSS